MAQPSRRKPPSLQALELLQTCAQEGSLQATAEKSGLSVSTVSHHLRALEAQLGVALLDHDRKPLALTAQGQAFLRTIDPALLAIRKATAEATSGDPGTARFLRVGTIEDLDSDVTPDLAVYLHDQMPGCDFRFVSGPSHEIIAKLQNRTLDLGVVAGVPDRLGPLTDRPLLRDPFVVVLPADQDLSLDAIIDGREKLPFLQFSRGLMIAERIEAQLRRLGLALPNKFECGNNQTLMAMVAAGAGWTITTPLLFARARRFHDQLKMLPFPHKSFARTLSLVTSPDCGTSVAALVEARLRARLSDQIVAPMQKEVPWLADQFVMID